MIKEGKPWPRARPGIVRAGQKLLLGPSGPNGVALDWHAVKISPEAAQNWHAAPGQPGTRIWWPRGWIGAAFAVEADYVERVRSEYPTARAGAAYLSNNGDYAVAGMLPDGRDFGQVNGEEWGDVHTLMGRTGPGDLSMAPVHIVPETSRVIFPERVELLDSQVAIGNAALLKELGNPPVV